MAYKSDIQFALYDQEKFNKELPKMTITIIATFVLKMLTITKQQPQLDGFRIYPGTTTTTLLQLDGLMCHLLGNLLLAKSEVPCKQVVAVSVTPIGMKTRSN